MAAGTQIPVEEYLRTAYQPDCEYIDGVVEERNLGELDHAWVQRRLLFVFDRFGLVAIAEWRFQISATRYRVPDVIVTADRPREQILTSAPMLCIEILSPEDTISRVNAKIQDYLRFGVPAVWIADPRERRIWIYRSTGMEEAVHSIHVDGTSIEIPLAEIFD